MTGSRHHSFRKTCFLRSFAGLGGLLFLLSGCQLDNPVVTMSCTQATLAADRAVATVDNTGHDEQLIFFDITDGLGQRLHRSELTQSVGVEVEVEPHSFEFLARPQANPLTLTISSPAGGDLASDTVWYRFTGTCDEPPPPAATPIPTLSSWSLLALSGLIPLIAVRRRTRKHKD